MHTVTAKWNVFITAPFKQIQQKLSSSVKRRSIQEGTFKMLFVWPEALRSFTDPINWSRRTRSRCHNSAILCANWYTFVWYLFWKQICLLQNFVPLFLSWVSNLKQIFSNSFQSTLLLFRSIFAQTSPVIHNCYLALILMLLYLFCRAISCV